MFRRIRFWGIAITTWLSVNLMPVFLWAQENKSADAEEPDWVLPYFAVMGLVLLGSLLLMRLAKRADTSLTLEEIDAEKQSQVKKH